MDRTAVTSSPGVGAPPSKALAADAPVRARPRSVDQPIWYQALQVAASLRVTVVLFILSFILVFFGTLAQIDSGIWTVVNEYFRSSHVWIPFQLIVKFGQVFFGVPKEAYIPGSFPYPGGWLLGGLLLGNLLAAHAVRFKATWARSGILVLHAGIIVMMLGELITGLYAVEGSMTIEENGSSNFVEVRTKIELAVIDPSDPKEDSVVAVPGSRLRVRETIRDERLPFNLEVLQYMVNSSPTRPPRPGEHNPATAGDGKEKIVEPVKEVSGADTEQKIDLPSAYVRLTDKDGKDLGTYLVSLWFTLDDQTQTVEVGGKAYEISLRFKRVYKPYTIHLIKFTHEKYIGTETPKDFASEIRLVDPSRKEDREVRIWMNNPLFYQGETFYQQGFLPGDKGTILQVVRNPGWTMPYISCVLVALGMLVHFGIQLVTFLNRRAMS